MDDKMFLGNVKGLFGLVGRELISKRNLYDLIQYSKVNHSSFWSGQEYIIGNTPQQGINWIGGMSSLKGVVIKVRPGSYEGDGWANVEQTMYHYSFKARNTVISYEEKANQALIKQAQLSYPIFLFTDAEKNWFYEGRFAVSEIKDTYVILKRFDATLENVMADQIEQYYEEGGKKYVTHLMAERNSAVVSAVKASTDWICEICKIDFEELYVFPYIEAHHKTAISTYSSSQQVKLTDFALLCPNCHAAVHLYMKKTEFDYPQIKISLSDRILKQKS